MPAQPVWVEGDPVRLSQILANLLSNAAKYTDEAGAVRIDLERDERYATLKVTDTGIGIPANMLTQIFVPFTQVSHSLDRARGGLGIGLALVRKLVDLHGGTIVARSEGLNRGSQFELRLPVREAPIAASKPAWKPSEVVAKRVLVVDDNRDAAQSLSLLLNRVWKHDVQTAYDGPMAIEQAREFRPEVVLLDIGLPGMDGYQTAQQLRAYLVERRSYWWP